MLDILVMLFFFLEAVFIHLVICRKRSGEALLLKPFFAIAFGNLFVLWCSLWVIHTYMGLDPKSFWGVPLYAVSTVIYVLLIPTYLVFYFSTQQMSPSKKILLLLSNKGPMSFQELLEHFTDEEFVLPRIEELIVIRFLVEHSGWYVLTPAGTQIAKVYGLYQAVFGREKGG